MANFAVLGVRIEVMRVPNYKEPFHMFVFNAIEKQCKESKISTREFLAGIDAWGLNKYTDGTIFWTGEGKTPDGARTFQIGIEYRKWEVYDTVLGYAFKVRTWGKHSRVFNEGDTGTRIVNSIQFCLIPILDLVT